MFTPADKLFARPSPQRYIPEELTDKRSPFYQSTHHLLSYKWKNRSNFVVTCYLDTVFEKQYSNKSEPETGLWWNSLPDILTSYFKQLKNKPRHTLTPAEKAFHFEAWNFLVAHLNFSKDRQSRIREVKLCFYYLFNLFNDCLAKKEDGKDVLIQPDVKPRTLDEIQRDNTRFYAATHQDDLKLHLAWQAASATTRRRGRPPKVRYYHPDLYGFP